MNEVFRPADGKTSERRLSYRLRSVFDAAYALLEPFLDAQKGWTGSSLEHLAFRVLRDNFSELTSAEVHLLVVAAHRAYIDRYPQDSDHLLRPSELHQPLAGHCAE